MNANEFVQYNESFYNSLWKSAKISSHEMWPVWKAIKQEITEDCRLLELGPGTRPRIPVKDSFFLELSRQAASLLEIKGGKMIDEKAIVRKKDYFDLVCAFEVLEHIPDDERVIKNISRATRQNGKLFISVPVHMKHWTELDRIVGHYRRYNPAELQRMLERNGFVIEKYAEDRMFSKIYSAKLLQKMAKHFITRFPKFCARIEHYGLRVMCAFARRFVPIKWKEGSLAEVQERTTGLYAVCRKA